MPFARLATATTPTCHIGFGLAAVGRPGYINLGRDQDLPESRSVDALRARTHELLDAAYFQGVRYFDAARSYGRSEEFLADWLNTRPDIDDIVVGSKWGYTYTAGWTTDAEKHEVKDHSVPTYERQRAETAQLLGDRLDLYQIHSVTPDSPALTDKELHAKLAEAAAAGVSIGFSTSGPAQADAIRAALAVTVDGEPLFRTVDLQRPGDLGRPRPRRGPRRRTHGDRQGGHGQRQARGRVCAGSPEGRSRTNVSRLRRGRPRGDPPPALGGRRPLRCRHDESARLQPARRGRRPGRGPAGPPRRAGGGAADVLGAARAAALALTETRLDGHP
jgi:hypothetical protein